LRLNFVVEVGGDIQSGVCFPFRAWRRTLWPSLASCISGVVWRAWTIEEVEFGRLDSDQTLSGFLQDLAKECVVEVHHFPTTRDGVSCNSFLANSCSYSETVQSITGAVTF